MSETTSLFEADATWGRLPYLVKYAHWPQTKLTLWETSRKCPEFKCTPPFIWMENDVIVHLHWNAPHKRGGKQSGDVNWLIIAKPHLLSTQEVQPQLRCIRNMMYHFTILVFGVTIKRDSMALTLVSDKSYRRASMKRLVQTRRVNINYHGNRGSRASAQHIYQMSKQLRIKFLIFGEASLFTWLLCYCMIMVLQIFCRFEAACMFHCS